MLTIRDMSAEAWKNSEDHGFHNDGSTVVEKLMLIVSEVAEALEAIREGETGLGVLKFEYKGSLENRKPVGFMSELADVVIRVGDLAWIVGGDLEEAVEHKMAYNRTRPHMHGGKKL